MDEETRDGANIEAVVPLLGVASTERSLCFYRDSLGFEMTAQWVVEGGIRWCRLELGGAKLMLQLAARRTEGRVGEGVSFWFQCQDALALYDSFQARGLEASEPEVGNAMWCTVLLDPDGYRLHFVSATDVPEDTKLSEVRGGRLP
jgi:lactoylglutathione lyase